MSKNFHVLLINMTEENIIQDYRLRKIDETSNYLIEKINK